MRTSLPSADDVFEAQNPAEFAELVDSYEPAKYPRQDLKGLIHLFLQEEWDGTGNPSLTNIGSEHLILLIFG